MITNVLCSHCNITKIKKMKKWGNNTWNVPHAHSCSLNTIPDRIGIWKCWLLRRKENTCRSNRGKLLKQGRARTNNRLISHMASTPGYQPGATWRASAFTIIPPLSPAMLNKTPKKNVIIFSHKALFSCHLLLLFSTNLYSFLLFVITCIVQMDKRSFIELLLLNYELNDCKYYIFKLLGFIDFRIVKV